MTIANSVAQLVAFKKEATFGTPPAITGPAAQLLRRIDSDLNLTKETYQAAEISTTYQDADMRHGTRKVAGSIKGDFSVKTYREFLASLLRGAWVAGAATTTNTTIAADSAGKTFTRTGSWITEGYKLGDVVRFAGFTSGGVGNNAKNFRIVALTATVMTVAEVVATKAAGDSVTCSVVGKKTMIPTTGQVNDSYSIEHYYSDLTLSEVFTGCRVNTCSIGLPATGMASVSFGILGQNMVAAGAQYFTSPIAEESTNPILAAVNGSLRVGGVDYATITGVSIEIDGGMSTDAVVGSNQTPDVFVGRVRVKGQVTAYFDTAVLRDAFLAETEVGITVKLDASTVPAADFVVFKMDRVKLGACTKAGGEKGIVQTIPFVALLNTAGGPTTNTDLTTFSIQDSLVP